MRINNNLMAMNTHRQLGITTNAGAKSTEKLSSGFRINRAGDDAAGLSISEKMRGQIRGLTQASRNSQDGISLIQTAEGALNETHAILQRMRELAVQSATDTNVEIDRQAIQDEMNQLTAEIDRISNITEFNTQGLLDGTFDGEFQIGANENQKVRLVINKMDVASLGLTSTISQEQGSVNTDTSITDGTYIVSNEDGKTVLDGVGNTVGRVSGNAIIFGSDESSGINLSGMKLGSGAQITISSDGTKFDIKNNNISNNTKTLAPGKYEAKGSNVIKDGQIVGTLSGNVIKLDGRDFTLSGGDLGLSGTNITSGISFNIHGSDVSTRVTAEGSITSINKAIETVSKERSKLGAMQNRLEHTIKNLDNSAENLQAAESRIRDVDMAQEMMEFTKQNILQQASTAMLAQANMAPQSVLQLLR